MPTPHAHDRNEGGARTVAEAGSGGARYWSRSPAESCGLMAGWCGTMNGNASSSVRKPRRSSPWKKPPRRLARTAYGPAFGRREG